MSETIVLDPNEELPNRVEFDLTPYVGAAGPDFGQAVIEGARAQAQLGDSVIDFRMPNRMITIPLVLHGRTGLTFDELRSILQAKVGLWQREGGVIRRETSIGPVYADVAVAALQFGGSTAQSMQEVDTDAILTLEVTPDWYGEEIDLGTETGSGEVVRVLEPERGDHPGRVRIVVTDEQGVAQLGALWGIRSRHYDDAPTAALSYEAEDLTPLDAATAGSTGLPGVSGGAHVIHTDVGPGWVPVLGTELDGVGPATHTGSYRVWVRAFTPGATLPRLRFAWAVGSLTNATLNSPVSLPGAGEQYLVDLGEIRLDPAPTGTHAWRGVIQASADTPGASVRLDKVWFQPLDEYAGSLQSPLSPDAGNEAYAARDGFAQTAGNLNGKTASVGGNWATSGDSTDLAVEATGHTLTRSTSTFTTGRLAKIGSSMARVAVRCDVRLSVLGATALPAIAARVIDVSNRAALSIFAGDNNLQLDITGGQVVTARIPFPLVADTWYTLQLFIDEAGHALAWISPTGAVKGGPVITVTDTVLAAGGALEDGTVGILDVGGSGSGTRSYDNFAAWEPEPEAVIHSGRSLDISTIGAFRENADGGGRGIVPWISGDLPRLPAPGIESRPVELLVKPTRGDLGQIPDTSPDDALDVQVFYRPSYLYVPNGGPGS